MMDPPRPEVKPAVKKCLAAGIRPVMITGDSPETALAIAQSVGIARAADEAVTGAQLDAMTDAQLAAACKTARVFARVSPAHKAAHCARLQAGGQYHGHDGRRRERRARRKGG